MSTECGNPAVESDAIMPRRRKYDKSQICVKCKENRGNVVIRHAVYCKKCFIPFVTFKFRRSLEPFVNPKQQGPRRTALKPSGNLLIGHSGGQSSTVLIDLVNRCYISPDETSITAEGGRDHPRHERVWQKITVCHIEVSDALPGMEDRTTEIRDAVGTYKELDFISYKLQDAFDPDWWERVGGQPALPKVTVNVVEQGLLLTLFADRAEDMTPLTAMRSYLSSLPTPTALHSTIKTLIRLMLQYTALQTGASHLILGTSLTSLAVSLISGISQGCGFHVQEEIQDEWTPHQPAISNPRSVRVIRPLRDIGVKECAMWTWWMDLKVVGRKRWERIGAKPGIGELTKDFIFGLEKDYPSTVSTIVRTCTKLAPKGTTHGHCLLCERPIQTGIQDWLSHISIRNLNDGEDDSESSPKGPPSLQPLLCYACYTTLNSHSSRPAPSLYPSATPSTASPIPEWGAARLHTGATSLHDGSIQDDELFSSSKMSNENMRRIVDMFTLQD